MTPNQPSQPPPWLARLGAARYKLAFLIGLRDVRDIPQRVRRVVPGCATLNLNLALSRQLLEIPSPQRPTRAPIILVDLLAGHGPALLYAIELLFEPTLQLEPLRALKAASRSRILLALWPGTSEDGSLIYAEPGHPEYKRYEPADLAEILVVPAPELPTEA